MAHFVRSFDCKNEEHVMWLKKVGNATGKSMNGDKVDLMSVVHGNPHQENLLSITLWIGLMYIFSCV